MSFCNQIKRLRIKRFAKSYHYNELFSKCKEVMVITTGVWQYKFFNACFLNNMLSLIIEILYRGYTPVIRLKNGSVNWDVFFQQPLDNKQITPLSTHTNHQQLYTTGVHNTIQQENDKQLSFNEKRFGYYTPSFTSPYQKDELKIWCKIYNDFVVMTSETKAYCEKEYINLIQAKNSKILGVLSRGSDYLKLRPLYHPIQPTIEELLDLCAIKKKEFGYDFIYLATEESKIQQIFENEYPGKIIANKRVYYDENYNKKGHQFLRDATTERENDFYLRGLEYLSSLYCLSKCNALIAGNCGGSQIAIFMNNMKYEYVHLFNLGLYT